MESNFYYDDPLTGKQLTELEYWKWQYEIMRYKYLKEKQKIVAIPYFISAVASGIGSIMIISGPLSYYCGVLFYGAFTFLGNRKIKQLKSAL